MSTSSYRVKVRPAQTTNPRLRTLAVQVVLAGLGASAAALAMAPVLMPASYSWVSMTTSESAAQGVSGAWLARTGFVLFGASVLLLVGAPAASFSG